MQKVLYLPEGHGPDNRDVFAIHEDIFTAPGYEGIPHYHRPVEEFPEPGSDVSPDNMVFE